MVLKVVHRATVTIKHRRLAPLVGLHQRLALVLLELHFQLPVEAEVVEANAASDHGGALIESHLELPPQDAPPAYDHTEAALDGHAVGTLLKVERIVTLGRCHHVLGTHVGVVAVEVCPVGEETRGQFQPERAPRECDRVVGGGFRARPRGRGGGGERESVREQCGQCRLDEMVDGVCVLKSPTMRELRA